MEIFFRTFLFNSDESSIFATAKRKAEMAQLVEQFIRNE